MNIQQLIEEIKETLQTEVEITEKTELKSLPV